ncbi:hypothetical protein [Halalkalibacter urbisdiaboli]|uniref:hypothetical protein n=1 Tax=Halalkalibacter urbisdiaboli TaxID=1960589 RepID=UPI000B447C94|nr:hypothetical protein [Halalkalibacter urbisdiaboli]
MKMTASNLIRWGGLAAMAAGILFIVIQPILPPENLSSVTTGAWAIIHYLTIAMSLFGLIGIAGIYARQVKEAGWLGWDMRSGLNGERKPRNPYPALSGIFGMRYETHTALRKFVQGAEL